MNPTNKQKPEGLSNDDGMLDVVKVYPTIQGEGPYSGLPAVFVRLAGCNLQCPLCDTQYTKGRKLKTIDEIELSVLKICRERNIWLVVVTGGEPFRQSGTSDLMDRLIGKDIVCQVETNGTLYQDTQATIVCSPKCSTLNKNLSQALIDSDDHCLKYVLDADNIDLSDGLPSSVLGQPTPPARPPLGFPTERIYLQPADVGDSFMNSRHVEAVVQSCTKFGYRLCIQTHKIAGLP